ncbi:sulfatase [Maioricimonas sp. JC845]|uniref:sulfatase family protein n=1 Tax=Maioricimonas sp. JC845 TaxID=3232138 RepID=UPI003457D944
MRTLTLLALLFAATRHVNADDPPRPNILFCIADDASQPHFGAYGCNWVNTPAFDRVAREGLLFTNAWTPNAKCAPSRACILTGRNTWQLEEACNHQPFFPQKFRSYVEALTDHGYFTGRTAKGWAPGIANDENGKPRHLAGRPFNQKKTTPPASGISGIDYAGNFEAFLDQKPEDAPFCFWYGGLEPHRRYEYGSGVAKAGKKITDIPEVPAFWPDTEVVRNDMLDYAFEIEYFDQHLGRMLAALEERGQLENTLVVVTSDNGMPFPRVKGQEYALSNHLPLAIMWPAGIENPGRTIDDFVNFIDFAPTFLEVAGIDLDQAGMQPITGRSLTEYFRGNAEGIVNTARDHVLIGKERHDVGRPHDQGYPIRGIVKDGFLYLRNFEPERWPAGDPITGYLNCDGSPTKTLILDMRRDGMDELYWLQSFGKRPAEELYDIRTDRECLHNLAASEEHRDIRERLRRQLMDELKAQGDPRMDGNGHIFDDYPVASPRTANYFERFTSGEEVPAGWVNPTDYEPKPVEADAK